jgi:two-component system cell cycle sensor histidine kinase/response regulator CckA
MAHASGDAPHVPSFLVESDAAHLRARLAQVLDYMHDGFLVVSPDWRIVYVNRTAARLLQQPPDQLQGRSVWDAFPEAVGTRFHLEYQRVLDTGEPATFEAEYTPLDVRFSVRAHRCPEGIEIFFLDIKEEYLARQRIREQASLLDQASDAIVVRTLDHVVTYWNQAAARLYGWSAEEAVGRSTIELMKADLAEMEAINAAVLAYGQWSGERKQRTRTGGPVLVEESHTLVRDAEGRPHRVLCIKTDVTQQRRVQSELMRMQRMESLGTLAGGIAHELNNTLAPVVMGIEAIQGEPCVSEVREVLDLIAESAKKASELVDVVQAFARGAEGERRQVDVAQLVTSVGQMVRDTFPTSIAVATVVAPHLWPVTGDRAQLRQALLNLCVNARDAMPGGGALRIVADNVVLDAESAAGIRGVAPGPHVRVEIADTGAGIPPDIVDRIFEPFYSTRRGGDRNGLGLAVVHTVVRSHRAGITVQSEAGRGSTFRLYLPATPA